MIKRNDALNPLKYVAVRYSRLLCCLLWRYYSQCQRGFNMLCHGQYNGTHLYKRLAMYEMKT